MTAQPEPLDETAELIKFQGARPNTHLEIAPSLTVEEFVRMDNPNLQKLKALLINCGFKARSDGLIEGTDGNGLLIQVWRNFWFRVEMLQADLPNYRLENLLKQAGCDLKSILQVHDQMTQPPSKPVETNEPQKPRAFVDWQDAFSPHGRLDSSENNDEGTW